MAPPNSINNPNNLYNNPENPNTATQEEWPIPQLHLKVLDLSSPGSGTFFSNVDVPVILKESVVRVLGSLYTTENVPRK